jgi:tetratricopeptide (TPR) repeat protein
VTKKLFFFLSLFMVLYSSSFAQAGRDEVLAKSYFQQGEFDKAAELYQTLWEENNFAVQFYQPLYRSLQELKKWDELEKVVKKQIKKNEFTVQYVVDLGYAYQQIPDPVKAKEVFDKIIKDLKPNEQAVRTTANAFEGYRLYDYVIAAYDKGNKAVKDESYFSLEMGNAYLNKNDVAAGVRNYLLAIETRPAVVQLVKNTIQSSPAQEKILGEMETQLYAKVQKSNNQEDYIDLLTWVYIQNKDFEGALMQMKALDRRKNENGYRVLEISRMAMTEGFYDDAINGLDYIVNKGRESSLYFTARIELLNCRKEKISKNIGYTQADLLGLKADYLSFINENERGVRTAQSMKELADLMGFYLYDIEGAKKICEEVIALPGVPQRLKNECKLSLGDFYLIAGDVWESTLLYGQVDKDEKDSPLGEEARFKNARLAYFKGDFEWAQTQLEALKGSTSELISNDAINLSVFIIDNLGLDTIEDPMQQYAMAELFLFQNQAERARGTLDTITYLYPSHALTDDILYLKSKIYIQQEEYEKAVPLLETILEKYKEDLKGDDATFLLAELYDGALNNKNKAMELYKAIITDYSSSILVVQARKKYRVLRGDN